MEAIIISSTADVKAAYEKLGVKESRVNQLDNKIASLPAEFTCRGLIAVDLKIGDRTMQNIPAFSISDDNSKYVLVGTLMQAYTDKTTASVINKEGANKGKYMVVNNKRVHEFAEGLSEAEVVAFCAGKTFKTAKAKDYSVFQPEYVDNNPVFADTADNALKLVKPKSYQKISEK